MRLRKNIFFIAIIVLGLLVLGCTPQVEDTPKEEVPKEDIAATVNDVNITKENFENTLNTMVQRYEQQGFAFEGEQGEEMLKQIRQQAIDSLVQGEVLFQEAEKQGIEVSEEEVKEQFELVKGQFPSEEDFNTALQENNLTEDGVRDMIARDMRIEQFVDANMETVAVSEEEMLEMYNQYKEQFEANPEPTEMEIPAFEDVKSQIEAQITQQKEQAQYSEMIEELMEKYEVQINI